MTEQPNLRSCKRALPSLQEIKTGHRGQRAGCTLRVHIKAFTLPFLPFVTRSVLFTPELDRSQRPRDPCQNPQMLCHKRTTKLYRSYELV